MGKGVVAELLSGRVTDELTAEERRNIAIVTEFLGLPKPMAQADRERLIRVDNYKVNRVGMTNIKEITGFSGPGAYTSASMIDRVDEIQDIIAKGSRVWVLGKFKGIHGGPIFGIPGTEKPIDAYEVMIFRLEDGKVVEEWFMIDELAFLHQIGTRFDFPKRPSA